VTANASSLRPRVLVPSALASCLLHGSAILALIALYRATPLPDAAHETGVEIVWQDRPEDSAAGADAATPSPAIEEEASAEAPPVDPPPVEPEQDAVEAHPPPQPEPPQPEPMLAEASAPEKNLPPPPPEESPPPSDLPLPPPATPALPRPAEPRPPVPPSQVAVAPAAQRQATASGAATQSEPQGGSVAFGAAVSPPGLLEGVRNPEPEYPLANRQRGEQGVVTVLLRISEAGEVMEVELVNTSGHSALDESARRAVQRWRFRPATRNGVPIPGSIRTAIHFRLR
jgi:periplasmic protein TonB